MARRRRTNLKSKGGNVPGLAKSPALNLLLADVAFRAGSKIVRRATEKRMLQNRYSADQAEKIVSKRSLGRKAASIVMSRIAMGSVPGAVLVGGGMLAKTLFDRSQSARKARRESDRQLAKRIDDV